MVKILLIREIVVLVHGQLEVRLAAAMGAATYRPLPDLADVRTRHGRHSVCLAGMSQRLQRRVRKDLVVQDRVEQGAHQLAVIGGAHRFSQFEQGKLVQGHRVMATFVSDFGRFSQRLTGVAPHVGDRHGHHDQGPDLHHSAGLNPGLPAHR